MDDLRLATEALICCARSRGHGTLAKAAREVGWSYRHAWTGRFIVKRQTIRKRLSAKLQALQAELRHRWHTPVPQLGQWLRSVVQGWFNYHAVPGNMDSLNAFRSQVLRLWFRALRRRSQRRPMTWARFLRLVRRWLPSARILHPHPNVRFDATHPRWEPYAAILHVRFCAGGEG